MATIDVLLTSEPIIVPDRARSLGVRCPAGRLQVVTLWQVIGRYAHSVGSFRATVSRAAGYEELNLTFAWVPERALARMADHLAMQPWVLDVWFLP